MRALVVNSCAKYSSAAGALLASLSRGGVPPESTHVVVGECPDESSSAAPGGWREHRVRWCNLDNTALLWALDAPDLADADEFFYVHDTCELLPGFWAAVQAIDLRGAGAVRLKAGPSMNVGLYSVGALRARAGAGLRALANDDPARVRGLKQDLALLEDYAFGLLGARDDASLGDGPDAVREDASPYGTGVPRRAETYARPGLVKYKANWGQGGLRVDL